jgi:medium-chain acyl-[acyl-carrier-protein] hydrolase
MIAMEPESRTDAAWFTSLKPKSNGGLRLFCFPYAGGGAHIFRAWPKGLPEEVDVYVAHLPGRGVRLKENAFVDLREMVQAVGESIIPFLDAPFAFFGHSMGAILSFELTRYLRRKLNLLPAHLFVSGRRAPQIKNTEPAAYDLPDPQFYEKLRTLNGTPAEVLEHPELMELMLPLLRADFSVVETYTYLPEEPLDCSLTAFGGLQDDKVGREQLEAWRDQTTSEFALRMLPGDHFFLNTSPQLLLHILSQELRRIVQAVT